MKNYIKLIRAKHWIKNALIFIPMVCAKVLTYPNILHTLLGFLSFSFAASFIYIVNDIKDIEKDKLHPRKKERPLPSGKISKKSAIFVAVVMLILSLGLNFYLTGSLLSISTYLLATYIILNIGYSFGLKNMAIVDIAILASGFIIRVYYGASILSIDVSNWLFLTILSASLFLGFGKRKKELIKDKAVRKVLEKYNEAFLDKFQYLSLTLMLVFYSLWAIEQDTKYLAFTIPILMFILMRYSLIVEGSEEGDPTTVLYQDIPLLGLCGIYAVVMVILLTVI